MNDATPHPMNPVAKDQKFLTCGGCKHGKFYTNATVGRCRHPDNMVDGEDPIAAHNPLIGKLTLGSRSSGQAVDAHFQTEYLNRHPQYPVVTDLQCCSNWSEKLK